MDSKQPLKHYDVIVIGGGATGAGTARDCALRGLKVLLVERFDFTAGATGRNHGLLHSGARYAVTDQESASECIKENMILRKIARHCVEETGGLFVTLPEDDLAYQANFVNCCQKAGINAEIISPEEAIRIEPSVNHEIIGAVKVPDGAIDPFRLTVANVIDARSHGADVLSYHEVVGFVTDQNRIVGVNLLDTKNGQKSTEYADLVINAGGIWGHHIAQLAGININMYPAKGALLIFGHRINNVVINRCRKPADADILVPGDTISLIGTTSSHIPYDQIDNMEVTQEEVDVLMREGTKIAPAIAYTRILRAYAGVRPLVASDDDPTGRSISRGIVCLDHATRDGIEGIITITGGKLMTYRLMAEWVTDLACKKLGKTAVCTTATTPLPGSELSEHEPQTDSHRKSHIIELSTDQKAAEGRHGAMSSNIQYKTDADESLVCECEQVSVGELKYAIENLHCENLINLRRRTRLGMGTCQGELCACRAAGILVKSNKCAERTLRDLSSFINERWKGMYPIAWGESLIEAQFMSWLYEGVCGLDMIATPEDKIDEK
jgi:glycerol-3-phosphate dehydrogenase